SGPDGTGAGRAQTIAAVSRAWDRRHPGLLARAAGPHAQRGCAPDRDDARDGAADPAHAREARARSLGRPALLADAARAVARVGLSVLAEPLGDRPPADGGAR